MSAPSAGARPLYPADRARVEQERREAAAQLFQRTVDDVRLVAAQAWEAKVRKRLSPPLPSSGVGLLLRPVPTPVHRPAPGMLPTSKPGRVTANEGFAMRLLEQLLTKSLLSPPVTRPIKPHAARMPSAERGVSVGFLRAVCRFFAKHGGGARSMDDVCGHRDLHGQWDGQRVSICTLTSTSGLSLVETCVVHAQQQGIDVSPLFGPATTYVSYAWCGSTLADIATASHRGLRRLQASEASSGGRRRFLWLDAVCASQNQLAGRYTHEGEAVRYIQGSPEYLAVSEDCATLIDGSLSACSEVILFLAPLLDEWRPPRHAYLDAEHQPPPRGTRCVGPVALTRAWVLCELATLISRPDEGAAAGANGGGDGNGGGVKLVVELRAQDVPLLRRTLETDLGRLTAMVDSVDVATSQLCRISDRELISARLAAAGGGGEDAAEVINRRLRTRLRRWLIDATREAVKAAHLSNAEDSSRESRGLLDALSSLLRDQGEATVEDEEASAAKLPVPLPVVGGPATFPFHTEVALPPAAATHRPPPPLGKGSDFAATA